MTTENDGYKKIAASLPGLSLGMLGYLILFTVDAAGIRFALGSVAVSLLVFAVATFRVEKRDTARSIATSLTSLAFVLYCFGALVLPAVRDPSTGFVFFLIPVYLVEAVLVGGITFALTLLPIGAGVSREPRRSVLVRLCAGVVVVMCAVVTLNHYRGPIF